MKNNLKKLRYKLSNFPYREIPGETTDSFIAEISYINFIRIRITSLVALILFVILLIWDIVQFINGKWNESFGYEIGTYFHSFLIIFLAGLQILCWKKEPESHSSMVAYQMKYINSSLLIKGVETIQIPVAL